MSDIEMTEESDFADFSDDDDLGDGEQENLHESGNGGDGDGSFEPIVSARNSKKSYDVWFKTLSPADIRSFMAGEVEHVSNILGCKPETATTLLFHFKWNKEKLIETYMEDEEATCKKAGVLIFEERPELLKVPGFCCDICCNDDADLDTLALNCNHRYCVDCFTHYLTMKISEEGESQFISCPSDNCKMMVDEKTVECLVKPVIYEKYQTLLLKTYVDDKQNLKWCPFPNCDAAVQCKVLPSQLDEIVPTVKCEHSHTFCFGCSYASDHQPATCNISKKWLKKCADDSETSNWIAANTKECPSCSSTIEKNGGCNHLTCKKCKYEFCWVCQGLWADHGNSFYNCSRYEEKGGIDARDVQAKSRAALERYLHYYNRYANHNQSAKLDKELFEKTEKKMEQMQQSSDFSWIQVQFLKSAVEVLLVSRTTLMWTYCFAFFLARDNNSTHLFEDNQRDLEMAVEGLSQILETKVTAENAGEMRKNVLDKTEYVSRRRQVLLSDAAAGHLEQRWHYFFP